MTSAQAARAMSLRGATLLIGTSWLLTELALRIPQIPFKALLKENLGLDPEEMARFFLFANIPIYFKVFAGILSDAVPLFGLRRKSYLILGLALAGGIWVGLGLVPRTYGVLLFTYFVLNIFLTTNSTVLGGVMVEEGHAHGATGRLGAQRVGIVRAVGLVSGPLGGRLASLPFVLSGAVSAVFCFALVPIFALIYREERRVQTSRETLEDVRVQFGAIFRSKPLWAAAGLVVLVIAAPGFTTPMFYYQRDTLKFGLGFIGDLEMILALFGIVGAWIYARLCFRRNLRSILGWSIVIHAAGTLFYLIYRTPNSAIAISALEGVAQTMAILPLYDLAARATPRGSEALGYCIMMSVWNLTGNLSDWLGSYLYSAYGLTFMDLVWLNAGTTALVLIAVPFLPSALVDRTDRSFAH